MLPTARRRRRAGGLAAVTGLLAVLVPIGQGSPASADPGPAPPSRQRTILNDVHTDAVDVRYVDGQLRLQSRVGSPPFEFFPASDVLFQLKDTDSSRLSIPDIPEYAFLGPPGAPIWVAPQTQDEALLFAGWDTEGIAPGVLAGDAVDLRLVSVTGPGTVEVFQVDSVGLPLRNFSSRDSAFRTLHQPVHSHVHANWVFSALGRYVLTFQATGTDNAGQPLDSGPVAYTWHVGGTQAGDVAAEPSATALSVSPPSAESGQQITLIGSVTPDAPGWVEFHDGTGVLGHAAVSGGQAALTTTLAAGAHELTAHFVPANSTDNAPSASPPVTYQVSGDPVTTTTTEPTISTGPTSTTTGTTENTTPVANPTTTTTSCAPVTATATGVVLGDGHVDYAARIMGGALVSQVKDGTAAGTTTWREPAGVVFHVVPAAATTVPGTGFGFLGNPGDQVWQIPQTQKAGILWLGWNTEEITGAQVSGGITWTLDRVDGPGKLAVYLFDPFGAPRIQFSSGDGLPDRFDVPLGTHAHGNWTFTKQGVYRVWFTQSATLTSGARVSDTETVTFAVGQMDPRSALPTTTSGGCVGAPGPQASSLPHTGFAPAAPLAVGGLLLLAGLSVVALARAGRHPSTVDSKR